MQGFLAEGLQRTTAGLGSVIIDSQPLTVAVLAALLFGEELTTASYVGLGLGVVGLSLLELPVDSLTTLPQKALGLSSAVKTFTVWHCLCCITSNTTFWAHVLQTGSGCHAYPLTFVYATTAAWCQIEDMLKLSHEQASGCDNVPKPC